ncbi:protein of unknown function (plasmid) [Cupriavidus taiwanensis]|nr:protein of unknown function [Cupriavidus taiwanensis]
MTTQPDVLKPLKTWSHLAARRRKPSEYEIVSTNLHYTTDNPHAPFELDPNFEMAQWFKRHRNASPLKHADWNAFRDPDELVYRTYNILQDGQETYVSGLLDQFSQRGHDSMLEHSWAGTLARLYTPARYLFHTLQMGSAYVTQMAPPPRSRTAPPTRPPTRCVGSPTPRIERESCLRSSATWALAPTSADAGSKIRPGRVGASWPNTRSLHGTGQSPSSPAV